MRNNFITLTLTNGNIQYLNISFITCFYRMEDRTVIRFLSDKTTVSVVETPEEIIKKIENGGVFNISFD